MPVIEPSPITEITLRSFSPFRSRPTAKPADEIEVEECAAPNGSYSLERLVKPDGHPGAAYGSVSPARQDLVRITLMTHVPDQNVPRRVEHIVDRRRNSTTQTRTKMTACLRDRVHRRVAQLVRQLTQITLAKPRKSEGSDIASNNGV